MVQETWHGHDTYGDEDEDIEHDHNLTNRGKSNKKLLKGNVQHVGLPLTGDPTTGTALLTKGENLKFLLQSTPIIILYKHYQRMVTYRCNKVTFKMIVKNSMNLLVVLMTGYLTMLLVVFCVYVGL